MHNTVRDLELDETLYKDKVVSKYNDDSISNGQIYVTHHFFQQMNRNTTPFQMMDDIQDDTAQDMTLD